jgi:hypothetical protein
VTTRGLLRLGALACLGAACAGSSSHVEPHPTSTTSAWHVPTGHVAQVVLTPDGGDRYVASVGAPGSMTVSAPATNQGGNLRVLLWQPDGLASVDQQTCATWPSVIDLSRTGPQGVPGKPRLWQPGIALRIATDGTVTKAISIAQNVWAGATWVFWVQMWDTGAEPKMHATVEFDARHLLLRQHAGSPPSIAPPPWHVCARVLGRRLDFKIWTGRAAEPSYRDPVHAFHTLLPAGWVYPGYTGNYAGHLQPGTSVRYTGFARARH